MDELEPLADFEFLLGGIVGYPFDALPFPFVVLGQSGIALLHHSDLLLLGEQARDPLGTAQHEKCITAEDQKRGEVDDFGNRRSHAEKARKIMLALGSRNSLRKFSMTDKIVVLSTCASSEEAEKLARAVVEQRLAACVNVIPAIRSYYRWQGNLENAEEWLLVMKSSREQFAALRAALEKLHSYELPEIIALPIIDGAPGYLDWLAGNLAGEAR
jgi:periplasmic divalent cation tolerance protein